MYRNNRELTCNAAYCRMKKNTVPGVNGPEMNRENYNEKVISVEEVLEKIRPGDTVFLSSEPASPSVFIKALNMPL